MVGTACLVLSAQFKYVVAKIRAVPLNISNAEEQNQVLRIVLTWARTFSWLDVFLNHCALACLVVFMVTFSAGLYSLYIVQGMAFTAYWILFVCVTGFLVYQVVVLYMSKTELVAKLKDIFQGGTGGTRGGNSFI